MILKSRNFRSLNLSIINEKICMSLFDSLKLNYFERRIDSGLFLMLWDLLKNPFPVIFSIECASLHQVKKIQLNLFLIENHVGPLCRETFNSSSDLDILNEFEHYWKDFLNQSKLGFNCHNRKIFLFFINWVRFNFSSRPFFFNFWILKEKRVWQISREPL